MRTLFYIVFMSSYFKKLSMVTMITILRVASLLGKATLICCTVYSRYLNSLFAALNIKTANIIAIIIIIIMISFVLFNLLLMFIDRFIMRYYYTNKDKLSATLQIICKIINSFMFAFSAMSAIIILIYIPNLINPASVKVDSTMSSLIPMFNICASIHLLFVFLLAVFVLITEFVNHKKSHDLPLIHHVILSTNISGLMISAIITIFCKIKIIMISKIIKIIIIKSLFTLNILAILFVPVYILMPSIKIKTHRLSNTDKLLFCIIPFMPLIYLIKNLTICNK